MSENGVILGKNGFVDWNSTSKVALNRTLLCL